MWDRGRDKWERTCDRPDKSRRRMKGGRGRNGISKRGKGLRTGTHGHGRWRFLTNTNATERRERLTGRVH